MQASITPLEMDAFAKARSSRERAKEPVPFLGWRAAWAW